MVVKVIIQHFSMAGGNYVSIAIIKKFEKREIILTEEEYVEVKRAWGENAW